MAEKKVGRTSFTFIPLGFFPTGSEGAVRVIYTSVVFYFYIHLSYSPGAGKSANDIGQLPVGFLSTPPVGDLGGRQTREQQKGEFSSGSNRVTGAGGF